MDSKQSSNLDCTWTSGPFADGDLRLSRPDQHKSFGSDGKRTSTDRTVESVEKTLDSTKILI